MTPNFDFSREPLESTWPASFPGRPSEPKEARPGQGRSLLGPLEERQNFRDQKPLPVALPGGRGILQGVEAKRARGPDDRVVDLESDVAHFIGMSTRMIVALAVDGPLALECPIAIGDPAGGRTTGDCFQVAAGHQLVKLGR